MADDAPQPLASDYMQLATNAVCLVLGLPLNLITLWPLVRRYSTARGRIQLLYLNMTAADLLVLLCYSCVHVYWLLSYEWRAGDAACRALKLAESVAFAGSSYVVVCVAIDRLYTLYWPFRADSHARVARMLAAAWTLAALVSAPQLVLWQAYTPASMGNFTQCLSVWVARADERNGTTALDRTQMRAYSIYHMVVVFWLPLALLLICYGFTLRAVVLVSRSASVSVSLKSRSRYLESDCLKRVSGHARLRRAKVRAVKITLTLVTIYICCWLPYNTLSWWKIIDYESYVKVEDTLYFLHGLVVFNSVLNPLVYGKIQLCTSFRNPAVL